MLLSPCPHTHSLTQQLPEAVEGNKALNRLTDDCLTGTAKLSLQGRILLDGSPAVSVTIRRS